jgi:hypothetical protein
VRKRSVLTVLFAFNIEIINLLISQISISVMFVVSVSHFSFVVAQINMSLIIAQGCMFIALSVVKILLVTNFSWIFSFDPNQLGQKIIYIATAVAILPCLGFCFYKTIHGEVMTNMVASAANMPYCYQKLSFLQAYLIFWALLAFVTLFLTLLFIPHHLQTHVNSQAIEAGECNQPKKEINLKRILLALFGGLFHIFIAIIVNFTGLYQGMPINAFSSTTSLNLMLIFFIFDSSVWDCIQVNLSRKMYSFKIYIRGGKVTPESCQLQV